MATFQEAVFAVADLNIHLECSDDPITKQLTDLLCDYWISVRLTTATHNTGGTNDAVIIHCVISDSQLNVSVCGRWTFRSPSVDLAAFWSQDAAGVPNRSLLAVEPAGRYSVNFSQGITSVPVYHVARQH